MGTGYHYESKIVHDVNLEEPLNALAKGGAEFVLTSGAHTLAGPVDLVLLSKFTNWTTHDKNDNKKGSGHMYDLKAGCKILVMERFLKELPSYDGDDLLGDAALTLREKSSAYEPNGTIRLGRYKDKPRYVVKAELKAATVDRLAAHKVALQAMRAL